MSLNGGKLPPHRVNCEADSTSSHGTAQTPLRTEIIEQIIKSLETLLKTKMPRIRVRYSQNTGNSFCLKSFIPEVQYELELARRAWLRELCEETGLAEDEVADIDLSEFNVFLVQRQSRGALGLYGTVWHELAHVAAYASGIDDQVAQESIAIACGFRGLLQAAKDGLFSEKEVRNEIAYLVKAAQREQLSAFLFIKLERMGLKCPKRYKQTYHFDVLKALKQHIQALKSPSSSIDELIEAMEDTARQVAAACKRRRRYPTLLAFGVMATLCALFVFQLRTSSSLDTSIYLFFLPLIILSLVVAVSALRKTR